MKKLNKPYIFYLKDNDGNGEFPFAVVAVKQDQNGCFTAALTMCSYLDQFSKKIGRKIALGRLENYRLETPGIIWLSTNIEDLVDKIYAEMISFQERRHEARNGYDNLDHIDLDSDTVMKSLNIVKNVLKKRLLKDDRERQTTT